MSTGDLRSDRKEYRKSRSIAAIDRYTAQRGKGYEIPPRSTAAQTLSGVRAFRGAAGEGR